LTVTEKLLPLATGVWKVNAPLAVTDRASVPLSRRVRPEPLKPDTVPPIIYVVVEQLMTMLEISDDETVPAPFFTEQV
jgi:hypothetical protein